MHFEVSCVSEVEMKLLPSSCHVCCFYREALAFYVLLLLTALPSRRGAKASHLASFAVNIFECAGIPPAGLEEPPEALVGWKFPHRGHSSIFTARPSMRLCRCATVRDTCDVCCFPVRGEHCSRLATPGIPGPLRQQSGRSNPSLFGHLAFREASDAGLQRANPYGDPFASTK